MNGRKLLNRLFELTKRTDFVLKFQVNSDKESVDVCREGVVLASGTYLPLENLSSELQESLFEGIADWLAKEILRVA